MTTITLTEDALERIILAALKGDRDDLVTTFSLERLPSLVLHRVERRDGYIQVVPDDGGGWGDDAAYEEACDAAYEEGWDDAVRAMSEEAKSRVVRRKVSA